MIGEMVRDFCVQEIQEPLKKNGYELEASKHQPEIVALLEKSAELGLCGVAISEEYGGIDLDFTTGLIFSEMIAQGFSFATPLAPTHPSAHFLSFTTVTKAQKAKYLPGVASAKLKASYCLTEPTAGSDANSGKTKCVLNEAGTHYLMNGQKMWITNGPDANVYIVYAKTAPMLAPKVLRRLSWSATFKGSRALPSSTSWACGAPTPANWCFRTARFLPKIYYATKAMASEY